MKAALAMAGVAVLLYGAFCLLMYTQQRSLIYYPQFTRADAGDTDFALDRDGVTLRGWIVHPDAPDPILYFGGNAERTQDNRDEFAAWFPRRSVYLLAYRGYGASEGRPDEEALYGDALALYDYVRARHPDQRISAIGRSLGAAVVGHVAAQRPVDRLALITPFDSLAEVGRGHYPWLPVRRLLRDRFDTTVHLRAYDGPLLVLRAGRDTIIPPARTDSLVASRKAPAQIVSFPQAGHNDLHLEPGYGEALSCFMR